MKKQSTIKMNRSISNGTQMVSKSVRGKSRINKECFRKRTTRSHKLGWKIIYIQKEINRVQSKYVYTEIVDEWDEMKRFH